MDLEKPMELEQQQQQSGGATLGFDFTRPVPVEVTPGLKILGSLCAIGAVAFLLVAIWYPHVWGKALISSAVLVILAGVWSGEIKEKGNVED